METKYEFAVGDKVLAYSNGLLYPAKCLKRQVTDTGVIQYFIHYVGFKPRWDEWTDEDEVLEINPINLAHKERRESSRKNCKKIKTVKKSQKPIEVKEDLSKPVLRKRGRPKKILKQTAEPVVKDETILVVKEEAITVVKEETILVVEDKAIPIVENKAIPVVEDEAIPVVEYKPIPVFEDKAISVVKEEAILVVEDKAIPIVENKAIPVVEDEAIPVVEYKPIPVFEDKAIPVVDYKAIPILEYKVIPVIEYKAIPFISIPCLKIFVKKLRSLRLPIGLQIALEYDRDLLKTNAMILKFPEEHFVAQVIFEFIRSSYFEEDDNQKKYPIMFATTILKYFNESVHTHLLYEREKNYNLPQKSMEYFQQRRIDQPNINYFFKSLLDSNMIWCYVYGPTYLLRLVANLPKILVSNSWHPGYDSNTFIFNIKQLMQFLDDNSEIYFPISDYRKVDGRYIARKLFDFSIFYGK